MVFTVLVIILIIISSPFYIAGKYVRSSFLITHILSDNIFGFVIIFFLLTP